MDSNFLFSNKENHKENIMEWIPALSSTSLLAIVLFLSRNFITTRLTNAVRHEYDKKIEKLRTSLRQSEDAFKADLQSKEAQINALRSGVLSTISARQLAVFEKQINAIEQVWNTVIALGPAKSVSSWMAVIKFEAAAIEAAKNPRAREIFAMLSNLDINTLDTIEAQKARPFISPVAWAYFAAYQAIISHAVIKLHMLKNGIEMNNIIDIDHVIKVVKLALPNQVQYIEKNGPSAFHYLLDELESKLLFSFKLMIKGDEEDKEALEKASAIISESEKLLEASKQKSTEQGNEE